MLMLCPCGTGKPMAACCGPAHGGIPPLTAEALMRSRYTAFATGNIDYIVKTQAGAAAARFNRAEALAAVPVTEWLGLEVLATTGGGPTDSEGTVTFRARCRQAGRIEVLSEKSLFRRIGGAWAYVSGEVARTAATGKVGRNDPCPCGSGLKYKACCGKGA